MTNPNGKNRKKHLQALSNPKTAQMLRELQEKWKQEKLPERGDRVIKLLEAVCTGHGLADDLGVQGGTISRWRDIAELPPAELAEVKAGKNPTPFLRAAQKKRKTIQDKRTASLKGKQKELDRIVQIIIEFLDEQGYTWSENRLTLLNELDGQVWFYLKMMQKDRVNYPMLPLAPSGADPKKVIARFKVVPEDTLMPARISAHVAQLLRGLLTLVADRDLLGDAISKAMSKYDTAPFVIRCGKPAA